MSQVSQGRQVDPASRPGAALGLVARRRPTRAPRVRGRVLRMDARRLRRDALLAGARLLDARPGIDEGSGGLLNSLTLVSSAAGGVIFGLLADRYGRKRALMGSVLLYSIFTGLCGLSQTLWQLAAFRVCLGLGMGANGRAAPRWCPNRGPHRREAVRSRSCRARGRSASAPRRLSRRSCCRRGAGAACSSSASCPRSSSCGFSGTSRSRRSGEPRTHPRPQRRPPSSLATSSGFGAAFAVTGAAFLLAAVAWNLDPYSTGRGTAVRRTRRRGGRGDPVERLPGRLCSRYTTISRSRSTKDCSERGPNTEDRTTAVIDRAEWRSYKVVFTDRSSTFTFHANLTTIGPIDVLDLTQSLGTDPGRTWCRCTESYRVSLTADTLTAAALDYNWYRAR